MDLDIAEPVQFFLYKHQFSVSCNLWHSIPWCLRMGMCLVIKYTLENVCTQINITAQRSIICVKAAVTFITDHYITPL